VTDSKKLTTAKREALFPLLTKHCTFAIGQASVAEIDQMNILQATMVAMQRAFTALPVKPYKAFIDGNKAPKIDCVTETVVGGDAKVMAIAAASIIAKVTRDRLMAELDVQHPGYGWAGNAGYGTAAHQHGLATLGVTPHHRTSFAPIRTILKKQAA
jgi:ribonuclease HII